MKKSIVFTFLLTFCSYCIAQSTADKKSTGTQLVIPSALQLKKPFVVQNIEQFPDNELFVFDKQGNLIFHAEYYSNNWDGKKEDGGEVLEDEMCYYILDDGRGTVHSGYLQVVK